MHQSRDRDFLRLPVARKNSLYLLQALESIEQRMIGRSDKEMIRLGIVGMKNDSQPLDAGCNLRFQRLRTENSKSVKPVVLPPGLAQLATKPCVTGSTVPTNTRGTVRVASCVAVNIRAPQN
jgi:hypothetical protein